MTNVGMSDDLPAAFPTNPAHDLDAEPKLAWDRSGGPYHGRVYLAYTDEAPDESNDTDVWLRSSTNGGTTWTSPVRVHEMNLNSQFLPALALDQSTGNMAVSWVDARNAGSANNTVQLFATLSRDGGSSFLSSVAVSTGTTNAATAVNSNGLGGYTGLAFHAGVFLPVWADNGSTLTGSGSPPRPLDVATRRVVVNTNLTFSQPPPSIIVASGKVVNANVGLGSFTDADGNRPVSNYTATVSWGDGKPPESATISFSNNLFSVTTAVSHTFIAPGRYTVTVTVRDLAGENRGVLTLSAKVGTDLERLVARMYMDIMGRPVDNGGLTSRVNYLTANGNTVANRTQVAKDLNHSTEYRQYLVQSYYTRFLRGRIADTNGLNNHVNSLASGQTDEYVQREIFRSGEYYGYYGNSDARTLTAFYWDIMGRKPDPSGYNNFLPQMATGSPLRLNVLSQMVPSTEYRTHLVEDYYRKFLRRAADSGGLTNHLNKLNMGVTAEDDMAEFVGSQEYYDKAIA
jgi:hypothetical protein